MNIIQFGGVRGSIFWGGGVGWGALFEMNFFWGVDKCRKIEIRSNKNIIAQVCRNLNFDYSPATL